MSISGNSRAKLSGGGIGESRLLLRGEAKRWCFHLWLMLFGELALLQTTYSSISESYFKFIESIRP